MLSLIAGAGWAFPKYAGWSAVYSGHYGLRSSASLVKQAAGQATFYGRVLVTLASAAIALTAVLIPPLKWDLPAGLTFMIRLGLSVVLVSGAILFVEWGLSMAGESLTK